MPNPLDVVVIGGGSAGLCAAVAAARAGSKVALIERSHTLGGMGTQALVHTFCGLYQPDISKPPQLANPGLPTEIEAAMRERTSQDGPTKMGKVYVLLQDPEHFADLAKTLTSAEPNLTTYFDSTCRAVRKGEHFEIETSDQVIQAKAIVDASADAVVAEFLGATRLRSDTPQCSAFIFTLDQVEDEAQQDTLRMRLALEIVRAVQAGRLPEQLLGMASRASTRPGELYFTIDLAPQDDLMTLGKSLAADVFEFLKEHFPAFKNTSPPTFPQCPGVRESYRWLGQYTLTADDLLESRSFPDTIAHATWPIELREDTRGPRFKYFPHPAEIPLRALPSAEIPGIYFAGRCLSASHKALASLRVMGTCFATGQAAGMAAALYAQGITDPTEQARRIQGN